MTFHKGAGTKMMMMTKKSGNGISKSVRLPKLNIQKWLDDPDAFAFDLRHAAQRFGFFTLEHNIPPDITQNVMKEVKTFFEHTPMEVKMKMSYEHNSAFRGYMALGVENTAGVIDQREQVELASEETTTTTTSSLYSMESSIPNKNPIPATVTPLYERLRGKNQWPTSYQPSLQPIVETYVRHMLTLCEHLTQALSYSLCPDRQRKNIFDPLFYNHKNGKLDPFWQCKLASYNNNNYHKNNNNISPNPASPHDTNNDDIQLGVGAHTDSGFLTLILQDNNNNNNNNGGILQVYDQQNDIWMDVETGGLDMLVCNFGEIAELSTGGKLIATPHRVMMIPSNNNNNNNTITNGNPSKMTMTRTSIPFFYNPCLPAVVQSNLIPTSVQQEQHPTSSWKNDNNNNKAPQSNNQKHHKILPQYGDNAFKSLARSHPIVFQKHHPDLKVQSDGRVISKNDT